jgi:hypothetical protein
MSPKKKNNTKKKKTSGIKKVKPSKYDEKIKIDASFEELIKMAAEGKDKKK